MGLIRRIIIGLGALAGAWCRADNRPMSIETRESISIPATDQVITQLTDRQLEILLAQIPLHPSYSSYFVGVAIIVAALLIVAELRRRHQAAFVEPSQPLLEGAAGHAEGQKSPARRDYAHDFAPIWDEHDFIELTVLKLIQAHLRNGKEKFQYLSYEVNVVADDTISDGCIRSLNALSQELLRVQARHQAIRLKIASGGAGIDTPSYEIERDQLATEEIRIIKELRSKIRRFVRLRKNSQRESTAE